MGPPLHIGVLLVTSVLGGLSQTGKSVLRHHGEFSDGFPGGFG